jgi:hypothetical protein
MSEQKERIISSSSCDNAQCFCNRQRTNRRIHDSEGYLYLHTVGWICRRNTTRRKEDDLKKNPNE